MERDMTMHAFYRQPRRKEKKRRKKREKPLRHATKYSGWTCTLLLDAWLEEEGGETSGTGMPLSLAPDAILSITLIVILLLHHLTSHLSLFLRDVILTAGEKL